jgi:hypothetical protein
MAVLPIFVPYWVLSDAIPFPDRDTSPAAVTDTWRFAAITIAA